MVKETYSVGGRKCRLLYRYAVTDLETADTELIEDLESMMDKIFAVAEEQIEKELYKRGLMTCNAYLERIDDMRANGNYLVQDHIKELDDRYGGKEVTYVIACQLTEVLEAHYLTGFSEVGEPQFSPSLAEAHRYHSLSKAKQMAEFLMRGRSIVSYIVKPDTLK